MKKNVRVYPKNFLIHCMRTVVAISACVLLYVPSHLEARENPPPGIDFTRSASKALPDDWKLKVHKGRAIAGLESENGENVMHVKSVNSSFALEHTLAVDSRDYPYLTWTWKALSLPLKGDVREKSRDDQALQLLVGFGDGRIISYVWDANAPEGTVVDRSLGWPISIKIKIVVINSGESGIGKWLTNTRNVYQDYRRLFGKTPPLVKGIRLQTNSQYTSDSGEGFLKNIAFTKSDSYRKLARHE